MHEWILAEGIVNIAKKNGWRKIKIKIGELQGIDEKLLEDLIRRMWDGEFKIEIISTILRCNRCKNTWKPRRTGKDLEEIHFLPEVIFSIERCPKCGSVDFEIIEGRGIWVEEIQE